MKNFVDISLKLFATFFIIVFFYSIYRAEFNFTGHNRSIIYAKYLKYIIISIFFSVLFILSLRLKDKIKNNIVVFSYSSIISIYLIEFILLFNFNYLPSKESQLAKEIKSKSEKAYHLKIKDFINKNIYPIPGHRIFLEKNQKLYPLGYQANTNTFFCRKNKNDIFYKSDKHGFRNSNDVWENKNLDYVFLGDSFVHGYCVKDSNTMSSLLMEKTNKNVLNLGLGGFGPLSQYATFLEFAEKKKPKKVFWFFYEGNDLTKDIQHEKTINILMKYFLRDQTQDLILKQELVNNFVKKKIINQVTLRDELFEANETVNETSVLLNIDYFLQNTKYLRLWGIRTLLKNSFTRKDLDPLFKKILQKTNSKIKSWNGEMYFIYLPEEERYRNKFHYYISRDNFRNKRKIINIVKDLNIKFIDMDYEVFRKKDDPLALFDNHYSEEGYSLIVDQILKID